MDIIDDTAAAIILAMDDGDSINQVAEKTDRTYSWVNEWVHRLVEMGAVESTADGYRVADDALRAAFREVVQATARYGIDRDDAYVLPHFTSMPFAFTRIDAAYVWTHGGYQVARDYTDYPVFIAVAENDVDAWQSFFAACGIHSSIAERTGDGIYYVLYPVDTVDREWVDGNPVIPLEDAVEWMAQYRANFQPALDIIADEYDRPVVQNIASEMHP